MSVLTFCRPISFDRVRQTRSGLCALVGVLALCAMFLCAPSAKAADLYSAEATVDSRDNKQLQQAAREGLRQVLRRFTLPEEIDRVIAGGSVKNPTRLLDRYKFKQRSDGRFLVSLSFLPRVIEDMVRGANAPYLPAKRPEILAWIVFDEPREGRSLVNRKGHPIAEGLAAWQRTYGIDINYPVYDLEDRTRASMDAIWEFDSASIIDASARYDSRVYLLGRVTRTANGRYMGTWQYTLNDQVSRTFDRRVSRPKDLSEEVMGELMNELIASYGLGQRSSTGGNVASNQGALGAGTGAGSKAPITLAVDNIADFRTLKAALSYLEDLSIVQAGNVERVDARGVVFRIDSLVSLDRLRERLALDRRFREQSDSRFMTALPRKKRASRPSVLTPQNASQALLGARAGAGPESEFENNPASSAPGAAAALETDKDVNLASETETEVDPASVSPASPERYDLYMRFRA